MNLTLISSVQQAQHMFMLFAQGKLNNSDYKVLDVLREKYRNWKYIHINEVEHAVSDSMIPIPNLSKFNAIVYKVSALKEVLLGLDCHSYIFSLKKDPTCDLKKIAKYMDVTFCDYDILTQEEKLRKVLKKMMTIDR